MKKLLALSLALCMLMGMAAIAEGDRITATGVGQGIDGDVVVQVEADATTIYAVEVLEQNETVGIGSIAVEKLPGAIVEANSIAVDGIAGATVTSNAIKDAIRQALTDNGIDPAPFEVAQEAYRQHLTQQKWVGFYVYNFGHPQDSHRYGLYRSLVGPDEDKNDLMEHVTREMFPAG